MIELVDIWFEVEINVSVGNLIIHSMSFFVATVAIKLIFIEMIISRLSALQMSN